MVQFGEIVRKDIRVSYTADANDGYKVVGHASYDKDNKMTDAYGEIADAEGIIIARFSAYGANEIGEMRTNLNDVVSGKMTTAVVVTEAILAELWEGYVE